MWGIEMRQRYRFGQIGFVGGIGLLCSRPIPAALPCDVAPCDAHCGAGCAGALDTCLASGR